MTAGGIVIACFLVGLEAVCEPLRPGTYDEQFVTDIDVERLLAPNPELGPKKTTPPTPSWLPPGYWE